MTSYREQALKKLTNEREGVKLSGGASANTVLSTIIQPVIDALESFVKQDEEFAQAVAQGGTLQKCFEAVYKAIKDSNFALSDFKTYETAAGFFFPGCKIRYHMDIDLCGSVNKEVPEQKRKSITVSFDDLF